MKEIVEAKVAQVPAFKDVLQKSQGNALFVETTHDEIWGFELTKKWTLKTNPTKWPDEQTGTNNKWSRTGA